MINPEKEKAVTEEFKRRKVITIPQLAQLLECSVPTVRNRLGAWGACTSYNQNGRYYTLPDIPRFDEYGLWRYKAIFFSRYGNLKQTLVQLVRSSPGGLDASEIGRLLALPPRSFLSHYRNTPGLRRERLQGRFIYYSDEQSVFLSQRSKREQVMERAKAEIPSSTEAVLVLVDLIKHPGSSLQACSQRLERKGIDIEPAGIEKLLGELGLKKTLGMS